MGREGPEGVQNKVAPGRDPVPVGPFSGKTAAAFEEAESVPGLEEKRGNLPSVYLRFLPSDRVGR
jgi:hypothetical protein